MFGSYSFINVSSGNEVPRWFRKKSEQRLLTFNMNSLPNVKITGLTAGSGAGIEEEDNGDSILHFDDDDEDEDAILAAIEELFERSW
ncbi:hypothetical protein BC332_34068 [Capsicum chinense]|nr:hypothetical protein BC332_34068 [Capsicum chinense]